MERAIDYRSDLYSAGCVIYGLITGSLPFQQITDPLAFMHAIVAQPTPSPSSVNPRLPALLSDVVCKLLHKNADHRYQSAWSARSDLLRCMPPTSSPDSPTSHAPYTIDPTFVVGECDVSSLVLLPDKLYGRATQQNVLSRAYSDMLGDNGVVRVMSVEGPAGSGICNTRQHAKLFQQHSYLFTFVLIGRMLCCH